MEPSSNEVSESCVLSSLDTKPELLHQEEDGLVQAFRGGGACDIHQIELQHVKKCEECQEMFLNPAVDFAEG